MASIEFNTVYTWSNTVYTEFNRVYTRSNTVHTLHSGSNVVYTEYILAERAVTGALASNQLPLSLFLSLSPSNFVLFSWSPEKHSVFLPELWNNSQGGRNGEKMDDFFTGSQDVDTQWPVGRQAGPGTLKQAANSHQKSNRKHSLQSYFCVGPWCALVCILCNMKMCCV